MRRNVLLLEVLVAIFLITLCFFPLLTPHLTAYREQYKQKQQVELKHAVNLEFGFLYEKLLTKKISWEELQSEQKKPCHISGAKRAEYAFSILKKKGKFYLFEVLFTVQPFRTEKVLEYRYEFFVEKQ